MANQHLLVFETKAELQVYSENLLRIVARQRSGDNREKLKPLKLKELCFCRMRGLYYGKD